MCKKSRGPSEKIEDNQEKFQKDTSWKNYIAEQSEKN